MSDEAYSHHIQVEKGVGHRSAELRCGAYNNLQEVLSLERKMFVEFKSTLEQNISKLYRIV